MLLPDLLKTAKGEEVCIEDGISFTYGDLDSLSSAIAAELARQGVGKGDRVAILLPNSWQFVAVMFGIAKAGAIATLLDFRSSAREVEFFLSDSKASFLFVDKTKWDSLDLKEHRVPRRLIDSGSESPLFEEISKEEEPFDGLSNSDENDVACILYTGGTTGISKGVMLTHRNFSAVLSGLSKAWQLGKGKEVFAQILPMTHTGGLNCGLNSALFSGGRVVMIRKFEPYAFIETALKYKVTAFAAVPTVYWLLTNQDSLSKLASSSLRLCFSSGAPLSSKIAERFREKTGITINVGWGLSEASPQLAVAPLGVFEENYVGIPIESTDVVSLDSADSPNDSGVIGELAARGPQIMKGYWMNDRETSKVFTKEGYLKTGDVGFVSDKGVYLLGRKKDVINSGGYKIWPHEVESVLMENENVKEAAIVAVEDDAFGEAVKAYVVLRAETRQEDLRAFCRARLSSYKVPKYFEFVDSLPKSSVGKILHRVLRDPKKEQKSA